jgi:hypothetical protein
MLILAATPPQQVAASGICAFGKKCPVANLDLTACPEPAEGIQAEQN